MFDYSGGWSKPYRDAGYNVVQVDIKHGIDVLTFDWRSIGPLHGILAAPPCTDFTISGNQYWAAKDADGRTAASLALIDRTLEIVRESNPVWWALENPVGRLARLRPQLGKPRMYFHPCDYGDAYKKKTGLWGSFNTNLERTPVEPVVYTTKDGKRGSYMWAKLGGKSERTKALRSMTPPGFARAFFNANR